MFLQIVEDKKWYYSCDTCNVETEKRDDHVPSSGLEGWHVEGYTDVHICPSCQAAGKTPD